MYNKIILRIEKKLFKNVIRNVGQNVTLLSTFLHNELVRTVDISYNKYVIRF
jgi:hypothetical protein